MEGIQRGHAYLSSIGAGNRTSAIRRVGMRNMRIQWGFRPSFDTEQPKNVGWDYDGEMKLGTLIE
jgi:hypothetical protein